MIYYKEDKYGKYIGKYEATYNEEELKKIRDDLIDNCSKRTHITKEDTVSPTTLINPNCESIEDLKATKTNKTKSYSDTSEDKEVFLYDYIYVIYPRLVYLINKLLNGDEDAIYAILNYEIEYPINYKEQIEREKEIIKLLIDSNPDEAIKRLEVLKKLENEKELNKNCVSTASYFQLLNMSLRFKLLEKKSISEISAYKRFFNSGENNYDYDVESKKILKL